MRRTTDKMLLIAAIVIVIALLYDSIQKHPDLIADVIILVLMSVCIGATVGIRYISLPFIKRKDTTVAKTKE